MDSLGFWGLVVILLAVVAAVAVPNLITTHHHCGSNETSAIGTLRAVFSAEEQFRILKKKGDQYGTLAELSSNSLFSGIPTSGKKAGYIYHFTLSTDGKAFMATASPGTADDGDRMFSVFNTGSITYSTVRYATMTDPEVD